MTNTHKKKVTRLDYCQVLLSSQVNYTLTHFADHSEQFSHDAINRYAAGDQIPPRLVWENVQTHIVTSEKGFIILDDFVLDKEHSAQIELVRYQWSGNAKNVIKGIGVVTCVYVNPDTDQFWIIDYRIFAPAVDKKSKLDHTCPDRRYGSPRDVIQCGASQALALPDRLNGYLVCGKRRAFIH